MNQGFQIRDQHFQWGITLAEVAAAMPDSSTGDKVWLGGWPDLAYPGPQLPFGLSAVLSEVRAPARNKPVMQAIYGLTAPADNSSPIDPTIWIQPLQQLLGPAKHKKAHPESRHYGAAGVVYSAEWRLGPARLGLSVYGGTRQDLGGATAAGLFLNWADEITAARPLYEAARAQTAALTAVAGQAKLHHLARLGEPQRPYRSGFEQNPLPDLLRQSQRALYCSGLCETPAAIRVLLPSDHIVGLWAVPDSVEPAGQWALSKQYDTVLFVPEQSAVSLAFISPARGGGFTLLSVAGLELNDAFDSPVLKQLAAVLAELGATVSTVQGFDE